MRGDAKVLSLGQGLFPGSLPLLPSGEKVEDGRISVCW